jgi:FkbM family methyltransferase
MSSYPAEIHINNNVDGIDNWYLPSRENGMFGIIARDWVESHSIKYFKYLLKADVCIQAGGACGVYPKLLSRHFGTVYTFEPYYESFYFLAKNCFESNIVKFNAALGSKPGFVSMEKKFHANQGEISIAKDKPGRVPTIVIDHLGLDVCDLIQLDTEGHELEALKGAIETIKRCQPVISCEISDMTPEAELKEFMLTLGYYLVDMSMMDAIFVHGSRIKFEEAPEETDVKE